MRPEGNLSEADKSNGVTWRGSVHIKYAINNPEKDAWQDGTSTYHLIKKNGAFQV